MVVKAAPSKNAISTQPMLVGKMSFRVGVRMPKAMPTAVADTEIIAPASMQYNKALATLYTRVSPGPAIFLRYQ